MKYVWFTAAASDKSQLSDMNRGQTKTPKQRVKLVNYFWSTNHYTSVSKRNNNNDTIVAAYSLYSLKERLIGKFVPIYLY